jgi:hypothetical protein
MAIFLPRSTFQPAGGVLTLRCANPPRSTQGRLVAFWRLDGDGRLTRIWKLEASSPPD